jgi:hypothetical protein
MRSVILWIFWIALMAALLPEFLPAPLAAFITGFTVGGGTATWLYEKIRIKGKDEEIERLKTKVTNLEKLKDPLTPQDYKCLEEIYRFEKVNPPAPDASSIGYSRTELRDALSLSEDELGLVIENLKAQRLIQDAFEGLPVFPSQWSQSQPVKLTQRGEKVIEGRRASS